MCSITAGLLDLRESGHQRGAILQRPAVILHVGHFEPVGVEIDRHLDDIGELVQILPVHDGVDRQRQFEFTRPLRDFELFGMAAFEATNAIGHNRLIALKTDLHMREAGIGQRG